MWSLNTLIKPRSTSRESIHWQSSRGIQPPFLSKLYTQIQTSNPKILLNNELDLKTYLKALKYNHKLINEIWSWEI